MQNDDIITNFKMINLNTDIDNIIYKTMLNIKYLINTNKTSLLDSDLIEVADFLYEEEDIIYSPEFYLLYAEYLLFNDKITKAEEIINNFWFKNSGLESPPYEWWYCNYKSYMLNSIKCFFKNASKMIKSLYFYSVS